MISAVTYCTNSGASAGTAGGRAMLLVTVSGTGTSNRLAMVSSTAWKFCCTTFSPRLP
jgi:hypothetical protein